MQGKQNKNRGPLGPRTIGVVAALAFFGVAGTAAQATVFSSDSDSGKSVAAVESFPPKQTSDRPKADHSDKRTGDSHRKTGDSRSKTGDSRSKTGDSRAKTDAPDRTTSDSSRKKPDARSAIIARAKTWDPHTGDRVPYSQTSYHNGYRTDCSGFVSMALGLPKPGENTVGLTSSRYTERITMSELKKGDLVMDALGTNTTRHVVIFEKWANSEHTAYWAYEQRGRYGTDYRTRDYGLSSGSEYKAYRPKNL
ncbi:hypothetical protein [Actinomadura macra]|uniref:hypothetical protein n=1 Tax=Actinomadura macra TaxID=46164 RepID=UPI00082FEA5F|nr:hypothetical protein [Actinomadura macra]